MIIIGGELLVESVSHAPGGGLAEMVAFSGTYPSSAPAIFADQADRVGADLHLFACVGRDPKCAGDCFCGTLPGLLDQGQDFEYVLRAANLAGGLHVTRCGPMEWSPTRNDIRR